MEAVRRVFKFGLGGAVGTGIGLVIGSLLAPQKGEDLQKVSRALIDEAKRAGAEAQSRTEAELTQKFRNRVNDQAAFTEADRV
jgi:gas vesicle protein